MVIPEWILTGKTHLNLTGKVFIMPQISEHGLDTEAMDVVF